MRMIADANHTLLGGKISRKVRQGLWKAILKVGSLLTPNRRSILVYDDANL